MSTNKLDELEVILSRLLDQTSQSIIRHMEEVGEWCFLGRGHFSNVYKHIDYPEYAVKVCKTPADSWPFFAKYCMDNKDNEAVNFILPNVYSFHKIASRGLYLAVLDNLNPIAPTNTIRNEHVSTEEMWQLNAIADGFGEQFYSLDSRHYPRSYDRYKRAAELVHQDLEPFCSIDLHGGNVMRDDSNNILITDPVSFSPRESAEAKIEELSCLVQGVEYHGKEILPAAVIRERERRARFERCQIERQKQKKVLTDFFNKINDDHITRTRIVEDRKIIGRDLNNIIFDDLATLERRVSMMRKYVNPCLDRVGVVNRNPFLAAKLGHHM